MEPLSRRSAPNRPPAADGRVRPPAGESTPWRRHGRSPPLPRPHDGVATASGPATGDPGWLRPTSSTATVGVSSKPSPAPCRNRPPADWGDPTSPTVDGVRLGGGTTSPARPRPPADRRQSSSRITTFHVEMGHPPRTGQQIEGECRRFELEMMSDGSKYRALSLAASWNRATGGWRSASYSASAARCFPGGR